MTKPDREQAGYFDASVWETARRQGDTALKRLINGALDNTSNTCVLIGSLTYARPWVRYELLMSFRRGNHLLGVHINGIKSKDGTTKECGPSPLEHVGVTFSADGQTGTLWEKRGAEWTKYERINGSADYKCDVAQQYRGKGFTLANWSSTYKWNADDGYRNFPTWVK